MNRLLLLCGLVFTVGGLVTLHSNEAQPKLLEQSEKRDEVAQWKIETAKIANNYVILIDQGRFNETWKQGADIFKLTITEGEWVKFLQMLRQELGAVRERKWGYQKVAFDPKGLPKGAYMVVEFSTLFQKFQTEKIELLTLMQTQDGTWKVLTYQVI